MYYLETVKDDGVHKYVASVTGANVIGKELDDGVYKFESETDCERIAGVINKTWGSGIWEIVAKKVAGSEQIEENLAQITKEENVQNKKKKEKPVPIDTAIAKFCKEY
ncbi:MAG: hypothetical protein LBU04_01130 [Christensenellaceae bacterium]|jgi:hypothetical protein|nr:hypothetical protein [Christensenellaceae bacterium]